MRLNDQSQSFKGQVFLYLNSTLLTKRTKVHESLEEPMKRFPLSMFVCILLLFLAIMLVTARTAHAAFASSTNWQIINSPNMGSDNNQVTALSAVSSNDVWATGSFTIPGTQTENGLIEHWDGSQWSTIPNPNPGSKSYFIKAVSAVSTNDVWVVGFTADQNGKNHRTLTEHWDGSQWSIIPSQNPGAQDSFLEGVVAISTNNVWAVGVGFSQSVGSTLILHWNGTQWSVVPSPKPAGATFYSLGEARAVSVNDIWAVGFASDTNNVAHTLTEHWNGSQWNIVPSPNVGSNNNFLYSVTTVSTSDVWAVGIYTDNNNINKTLIEHWDGTQWSIVPSPNGGSSNNFLGEVSASSANDIWTVGAYNNTNNVSLTMIEHWNGSKWSIVPSPNFGQGTNYLTGLTVVTTNDVWAVGGFANSSNINRTLIEHCC
jgi:hypothetical protein